MSAQTDDLTAKVKSLKDASAAIGAAVPKLISVADALKSIVTDLQNQASSGDTATQQALLAASADIATVTAGLTSAAQSASNAATIDAPSN